MISAGRGTPRRCGSETHAAATAGSRFGVEHSRGVSAEVGRTVTVTGSASAAARPDRAALGLGVQSRRPSARSAMAVVDERAATLVSALRDAGARDEDLRTTGL